MAELYLLDTCVLNETNARVETWFSTLDDPQIYISVASIMESRKGIELLRPRKPDVAAEIERDINDMIANCRERIVHIDPAIADHWGRILARNPRRNRTNVCMDAAIAASAIGRFWVATNNVDDFRGLGLNIVNPFRDPPQTFKD